MPDQYPRGSSVPRQYLVSAELQPQFLELDDCPIEDISDLGTAICSRARAGNYDEVACIQAETGRQYTYRQLDQTSSDVARGLVALGLRRGDRVALRASNCPETAILAVGCWKAGAITVPTPAQARATELDFYLRDVGARLLFVESGKDLFEEVTRLTAAPEFVVAFGDEPPPEAGVITLESLILRGRGDGIVLPTVHSDDIALIWHSGGTTGPPKAIYHTHRRALLGSYALARSTGVAPRSVWSAAAPVGHALGFASHTFWALLHGATVVFIENFADPRSLLSAIRDHRIEGFAAITMTWARMAAVLDTDPSADVSSLRRTYAMWQSLASSEVFETWLDRGIELLNNFGCTAFASWILAPQLPGRTPRGALGVAVPGYEVRVVQPDADSFEALPSGTEGRLVARGVSGLTYWNRPDMQARDVRDGWTVLDDLVVFDDSGNALYRGRTDNVISTAGHKVSPVEVEEVIAAHPAVREVAVIGAPDELRHEVVTAFVVVRPDVTPDETLARELQRYVKEKLAPYKYPRRVEFIPALPRDHVGKLQPRTLRDWATEDSTSN
jgi:2-aminobenzoate-CoA ligase